MFELPVCLLFALSLLTAVCFPFCMEGVWDIELSGVFSLSHSSLSLSLSLPLPCRTDIFVFLLSTRAGGLGINLTAADTVRHSNTLSDYDFTQGSLLARFTVLLEHHISENKKETMTTTTTTATEGKIK